VEAIERSQGFVVKLLRNNDYLVAAGVVGVLVLMLIPLPTICLDILLSANISLSIVILMVSMYTKKTTDFAVFPGLLLVITLFRLGLNVASTRLILTEANSGMVINAFGTFVTKGNAVVGFIIFIILVIIQFVVITKGAGRIAEVAARFTLDAMPGKQMAVDAELGAGLINETEARQRRRKVAVARCRGQRVQIGAGNRERAAPRSPAMRTGSGDIDGGRRRDRHFEQWPRSAVHPCRLRHVQ
jgi:flagellar biosynthesis protein FlhA